MKVTLRSLLVIAAIGFVSVPAISFAEDAPPAKKRAMMTPEQQVARLDTAVGPLTDAQKTKITAIYTKSASDMAALSPEDRQAKMADMRADTNKQVRAVLTPDQQTKFDAMPPAGGKGGGKKSS